MVHPHFVSLNAPPSQLLTRYKFLGHPTHDLRDVDSNYSTNIISSIMSIWSMYCTLSSFHHLVVGTVSGQDAILHSSTFCSSGYCYCSIELWFLLIGEYLAVFGSRIEQVATSSFLSDKAGYKRKNEKSGRKK